MKILNAKINGKIVAKWPVPERSDEIKYRQMIMYADAYETFLKVKEPTIKDYMAVMAAFFDMSVEEIRKLPMSMFDDFEKNMTGLFLYIFKLIVEYEPKIRTNEEGDHLFTYKGEEWALPYALIAKEPELTFGQGIDLMDIRRKAEVEAENRPDDVSSIIYSAGLNTLATVARKAGEELPEDPIALRELVAKRVQHFADIDMVTMQDCIFFSTRGKAVSLKTKISPGFSIRRALTTALNKRPRHTVSEKRRAS